MKNGQFRNCEFLASDKANTKIIKYTELYDWHTITIERNSITTSIKSTSKVHTL